MASAYSRRHYENTARILKGAYIRADHAITDLLGEEQYKAIEGIQAEFESLFTKDNSRFDSHRFRAAVDAG